MIKQWLIRSSLCFCLLGLSGCTPHILDELGLRDETIYPPTLPPNLEAPPKRDGSIYQAGYDVPLYQDHIANRVGDIITVRLEEQTQGQKKAKTKTNKTTSGTYTIPDIYHGDIQSHIGSYNTDNQFNGGGDMNQQNRLNGTVSVTVMRVLANGNLFIQGESWLTINQGREYVRLAGIIRPEDIDSNNSVSSQRIAGARIAYSGGGQVGNNSRGGFITQLLLKFFPY